jgi:hypothetical protein
MLLPFGEGLQQLVDRGVMRPLTEADVAAWHSRLNATPEQLSGLPPDWGPHVGPRSFFVTQETKFPSGLTRDQSAYFMMAEGVSAPSGWSHCTFYTLIPPYCSQSGTRCQNMPRP